MSDKTHFWTSGGFSVRNGIKVMDAKQCRESLFWAIHYLNQPSVLADARECLEAIGDPDEKQNEYFVIEVTE